MAESAPAAPSGGPGALGSRTWLTVLAMSLASGMVWLAVSDLAIVLPTIQREFDASFSELQWINGVSFTISLAALVVVGGRLADAYGRRRVLWWGLAIFAAASTLAALVAEPVVVIIGRGLQGVGAALILPTTLAIIVATVPSGARGLPIGVWGAATALFQGAAPAIAGGFEELGLWQAVFWINLPLALIVFLVTRAVTDESYDPQAGHRLDPIGTVLLALAVTGLSLVLIQGDEWGWGSVETVGVGAVTVLLMASFAMAEARSDTPLVRLDLFRNPLFTSSNVFVLTANLAFAGLMFFLALYLQDVLGESAVIAGLAFLPGAVVIAALAPATGRLFDRAAPRWSAMPGALLYVAAFLVAIGISADTGYTRILVVFLLVGAGTGFVVTYTAAGAVHAAPPSEAGTASGVLTIASTIGTALGTVLTGAIFEAVAEPDFAERAEAQGVDIPTSLTDQLTNVLSGSDSGSSALASYSGSAQQIIVEAARRAFVEGLRVTVVILAVMMAVVAVLVWFTARRRYFDPQNQVELQAS